MKKHGLILVFLLIFPLLPLFEASVNAPGAQPPLQTDTLYVGRGSWGPTRADPARAYDKLSQELISNVYETLITYNGEIYWDFVSMLATNVPSRVDTTIVVTNTSAVGADPTGSAWTSGLTCVGFNDFNGFPEGFSQGDVLYLTDGSVYRTWYIQSVVGTYTLTLWRGSYTFNIRTSPVINYYDMTGAWVDTFDIDDVVYALQRGLCQDTGPQWMYYKALFGTMNSGPWDADSASRFQLANLINSAVERSGNDLIINLGIPFPDNAFKQILCNTYGSIVSKQYSISIGCWDGNLLNANSLGDPDWWNSSYVRRKSRSPYDTTGAYKYCGTGAYYVSVFNQTGNVVNLQINLGWWQGWPCAGRKSMLSTIELDYISDWSTRKAAFLSEAIDICDVPRANMFELLQHPNTNAEPILIDGKPVIKTIKNIVPTLSLDSILFTFVVDPSSPYIGTGSFPNGIPTDFFNNTHVRKAFAYSFNTTRYTEEAWFGEADYRKNFLAAGLYPDYYNDSVPGYTENFTAAKLELQAATFPGVTGSVWDSGFNLTMAYDTGNDQRRIVCEMTRDFFQTLSTYYGRIGSPFVVNIVEVDWSSYLGLFATEELPIFNIGWQADFADTDDFARPYMHSSGDFAYSQSYTADNGWINVKDILIDQALLTPDGPARQALYTELAMIYYNDVPSIPITCPRERRWFLYWVKGWYYNAMYPGDRYNVLYKEDTPWEDVTGAKAGVPDGKVNMFDLSYVMERWGARAPIPGLPLHPRWVGAYGSGCPDVSGDRIVGSRDVSVVAFNYGRGFPQEQEHGGSVDLAVEVSKKVVEINYNVTVAVKVKNVVNLTGYEMCLLYDGSLLEIESWTVEPIPGWNLNIFSSGSGSFGSQKYLILDILSEPGATFNQLSRFSGDATLVTLLFKGLAEGNATLDISRSTLGVSDTGPVGPVTTPIRGKIYNAINDVVSVAPYIYNIAIDNMTSKSVIGRGYCANISTTLSNYCNHTESLNVTAYCNTTNFANLSWHVWGRFSTSTVLVWNSTGFAYGNYTIWAYAEPLPGEIDVGDNNCTCAVPVHVGVPGDVSGPTQGVYDQTVNMRDVQYLILLFNTNPSSPNWKPNADINNDGTVNMRDIQIAILNFNKYE